MKTEPIKITRLCLKYVIKSFSFRVLETEMDLENPAADFFTIAVMKRDRVEKKNLTMME